MLGEIWTTMCVWNRNITTDQCPCGFENLNNYATFTSTKLRVTYTTDRTSYGQTAAELVERVALDRLTENLYVFFMSSFRAKCPAHRTLLHFNILTLLIKSISTIIVITSFY